jgi:nitroreductase
MRTMATLDVFESVRTVLAVRQYRNDPIPADVVRQIVESAHLTASASNAQPWQFIVVQDQETLKQLGQLATTGPYIAQAPLAIVVVIDRTPLSVSDGSRAIQSMILTAWSHGIGSNWVGFVGHVDAVKPLLGIPTEQDVLGILPFGYPMQQVGAGKKKRKPLGEVVSRERFGQPYQ